MRFFDHASYAPAMRGKVSWFRLADAGLLVATAWVARNAFGDSRYNRSDSVLIAISIACGLVVFPLMGLYGESGHRLSWRRVWLAPAGVAVVLCVGVIFVTSLDWQSGVEFGWVLGWFAFRSASSQAIAHRMKRRRCRSERSTVS